MTAPELARAIGQLETAADLLVQAAAAIARLEGCDTSNEEEAARAIHLRALTLRILLETELRERVIH